MECNEFHELLEAYLDESLDEDRRAEVREHLRECDSCGERARGVDPSLIFAMAGADTVDLARVEACVASVTSQIRQERLAHRMRTRRSPWLVAAAAAIVVFGAAVVWRLAPGGVAQPPVASLDPAMNNGEEAPPPTVEVEMPGDDVRVYQFTNDDSDTAVYFIVNPALEL